MNEHDKAQVKQMILNLVEVATLSKRVIEVGSYNRKDLEHVLFLEEMCNLIMERYVKRKEQTKDV